MDKSCEKIDCRRNKVGGQALIEGVMMKRGDDIAIAVRKDDGSIEIEETKFVSIKKKHKWLGIPIVRGVVGFIESMVLSLKTMNTSTEMLGLEEEIEKEKAKKKAEKKAKKNKKSDIEDAEAENNEKAEGKKEEKKKSSGALTFMLMAVSVVFGLALALFLFTWLPAFTTSFLDDKVFVGYEFPFWLKAIIEGALKIFIFIMYILLVSLMKDIRRVFQYHGAEHKSIACYESGMELTPENAKKCTRFHPRCGTSFMFVMILLSVIIGVFIPVWDNTWLRSLIKIAILPLVMGLGYEFIMFAGKHDNLFTKIFSAPGLWMQKITTKEPDEYQLAVAICAIKSSMKEEFPDFTPDDYDIDVAENVKHFAFTGLNKKEKEEFIERKRKEKAEKRLKMLETDALAEDVQDLELLDGVSEAQNEEENEA